MGSTFASQRAEKPDPEARPSEWGSSPEATRQQSCGETHPPPHWAGPPGPTPRALQTRASQLHRARRLTCEHVCPPVRQPFCLRSPGGPARGQQTPGAPPQRPPRDCPGPQPSPQDRASSCSCCLCKALSPHPSPREEPVSQGPISDQDPDQAGGPSQRADRGLSPLGGDGGPGRPGAPRPAQHPHEGPDARGAGAGRASEGGGRGHEPEKGAAPKSQDQQRAVRT